MSAIIDISHVTVVIGNTAPVTVTRQQAGTAQTAYIHCLDKQLILPYGLTDWPGRVDFTTNDLVATLVVTGVMAGDTSLFVCGEGAQVCTDPDYSASATIKASSGPLGFGQTIPINELTLTSELIAERTHHVISCTIELERAPDRSERPVYVVLDVSDRTLVFPARSGRRSKPFWPHIVKLNHRSATVKLLVKDMANVSQVKIFASPYPHTNPFKPVVTMKHIA